MSRPEIMKTKYILIPGECKIIAQTPKVGSSTIREMTRGKTCAQIGIEEAAELRDRYPIIMYVRHPLDRLVSAWRYFTSDGLCARRRRIEEKNKAHHDKMLDPRTTFFEWVNLAIMYDDEHWYPQVDYHTHEGLFVPTKCYDLALLGKTRINKTQHGPWESYYKDLDPNWVSILTSIYRRDVDLYEHVRDNPEGVQWTLNNSEPTVNSSTPQGGRT